MSTIGSIVPLSIAHPVVCCFMYTAAEQGCPLYYWFTIFAYAGWLQSALFGLTTTCVFLGGTPPQFLTIPTLIGCVAWTLWGYVHIAYAIGLSLGLLRFSAPIWAGVVFIRMLQDSLIHLLD